jgi:serine/threonine protein kinase
VTISMTGERYERVNLLGEGLMSKVWLVRDTYTQELVVLKMMTAVPEDEKRNRKARERFQREIEIASSLHHPHILPIINYGAMHYDGRAVPFLVLPYMRDGSLADLIKHSSPWLYWSLPQTADAITQAAESLWYLHTRTPQIVHQDVKPGNFLLRSLQSAKRVAHLYLCDFGISRWLQSSKTMASEVVGTFAFMAPEQIQRKVNCASDQYALAVMACYLLTGKLPIQAATNEQYAEAHLHDAPLPPSALNPERITSSEVDAVILRALDKAPERRFPTILEFAHALERALTQLARTRAMARTEQLDLAVVPASYTDMSMPPVVHAPPRQAEPEFAIALDELSSEDDVLDEPLPEKPHIPVAAVAKRPDTSLPLYSLRDPFKLDLPARPKLLCWSRDGNQLACVLYGQVPLLLSRDGAFQEVQTANAAQAACVCWSPDGRALAVSGQGEIRFWDVAQQRELPLVLRCNVRVGEGMDWSAGARLALWLEGQVVIYTLPYTSLAAYRSPSGQTIATGAMRCGGAGVLRWSPDGTRLAAGASNGAVACWDVGSQQPVWRPEEPGQKVNSLAWSPDGALLAVAFRDNRVVGWDTHTRQEVLRWEELPAMPRMLTISTQRSIAVASGERRLLFGYPGSPGPTSAFPGQLLAAWSPAAPELATLDEQKETTLAIWQG